MDASAESIKSLLQQWLADRQKSLQEVLTVTLEEELGRLRPDESLLQRIQEQVTALQASGSGETLERDMAAALDHLEKAPTQAEALKALMDGLHPLSERCALYIIKQGIANLFSHRGFESDAPKSGVPVVPPPELEPLMHGTLGRLSGGAAYAALIKPLSQLVAAESILLPLRLRRKVVAVVLIDSGSRQHLDHSAVLRAVVLAAESTLSHLAAAAQEGTGSMPVMPSSATQGMPVGSATKPVEMQPPAPPAQAPAPPTPPQRITAPMETGNVRSSQPLPAPPPPAQALDTRDLTPSVPTQMVLDPIPMPAPALPSAGELDPKIRATAERLARVLVGDIELYFPQKVAQGKQNGNMYGLLREELDRSRHTFVERFGADVESRHHIFFSTVVNQLCDADLKKLGTVPWD